ncbi:ABC transporter permease [Clostridium mediterraneense]|uniref:ABC transporter permease n=1 Tax=Clostridium mediterraneense TaxID=1805472 RepID=UPI0008316267|nr:ABC transporter permease subunit [Clostridium mediterraneense]
MKMIKALYKYIYAVITILIFWYVLHILLDSFVIPNPIDVIKEFFSSTNILLTHVLASSYRLFIALTITIILGYTIGILIGVNKKVDKLISPILYLFFPVPRIAFLPVFMILFGLGDVSKIILIIAIAIFQIIITTRDAAKDIDKDLLLSARSLKLSKTNMIKHIYIPATLPKLFTSVRIALGSSMAALFFAENYATKKGIGYYIMNSWINVDYEAMYSGIIAISILGIILFKSIDLIQKKVCKW